MRWFRDHIKHGSWFALVALTINLGLSFGHSHAIEDGGFGHRVAFQLAGIVSADGQSQDRHDGDRADLLCPICMAASAVGHALASAQHSLPLAMEELPIDLAIEPILAVPQQPRAAFHSRGPPIS
jgi:hypothetical protein